MLKVNHQLWNQSVEGLRKTSLTAKHPRTRERFMALYEICLGKSVTQVGRETQRNRQTIMEWVHRYNQNRPETLTYRHTGGHPPQYLPKQFSD